VSAPCAELVDYPLTVSRWYGPGDRAECLRCRLEDVFERRFYCLLHCVEDVAKEGENHDFKIVFDFSLPRFERVRSNFADPSGAPPAFGPSTVASRSASIRSSLASAMAELNVVEEPMIVQR
jgi:hypothetical protein